MKSIYVVLPTASSISTEFAAIKARYDEQQAKHNAHEYMYPVRKIICRAAEKRFIQLSNRKNIVTTTRAENLATGNASDRSGLHSAPALFAGVVAKHLRLNAKMLSIVVMPAVRNPTARALRINHAIKKDTW